MKIKNITLSLIFFALLTITPKVFAKNIVDVYFFWGEGCPHCAKERVFLESLENKDKLIRLHQYEVYNNVENRELLQSISQKLKFNANGVPIVVVGKDYLVGYLNDETTGAKIKSLIENCKELGCESVLSENKYEGIDNSISNLYKIEESQPSQPLTKQTNGRENTVLPKLGNIDLDNLSLPALTVVLGFLDGFNPCAMWTLLFLISLLIGMEDKRKMWSLGIAFIVSSAFVYFLFMVAWLNLFLFVGYITWVRIIIGLISLIGGIYGIKKFLDKQDPGCEVTEDKKRRSVFDKLGKITTNKSFALALIGIIGLAFVVNLVELVCSAGLPAVYTQVLSLNKLSSIQYYLYILLYIFFFMLDDLFVFVIAMVTLQMTGITTKYVKWSKLIGGILMLIIGILLIFKPEILMFS